mgnify:CR=1 FL=1
MKKGYIVLIVIAVVVLSIFFWFKGAYNGMVNMREAVSANGRMWKTNINGAWI